MSVRKRGEAVSENRITLFVDESEASRKAKVLLRRREIPFDVSPSTGGKLPTASYQKTVFRGLGGVQHLADLYLARER